MEERFAILESTLTAPNYRVGNFRFLKNKNNLSFLKNFEKITKKRHISKTTKNSAVILGGKQFVIFESTLTGRNYRVGNFRFSKNHNNLSFLKIFEKITKNVIYRKLQGFEHSQLKARFAILDSTLTVPNYRVGNFRFIKNHNNLSFLKFFEKITKNVI